MARLASSHRRHAAHAGKLQAASVAETPSAELDGNAGRVPSAGFDAGCRAPAQSDRRLQGLESRQPVAKTARPSAAVFPVLTGRSDWPSGEFTPAKAAAGS